MTVDVERMEATDPMAHGVMMAARAAMSTSSFVVRPRAARCSRSAPACCFARRAETVVPVDTVDAVGAAAAGAVEAKARRAGRTVSPETFGRDPMDQADQRVDPVRMVRPE